MQVQTNSILRAISIDAFRAVIMVLMIFVNELWTLKSIPDWLGHVDAEADGMGLADVVFPAFLFIVGLSVPYAIGGRRRKGDHTFAIFKHIVVRSVALLIMGIFLVNSEQYGGATILPKSLWMVLLIIAFFLVWTAYKDPDRISVKLRKIAGVLLLIVLALIYHNESSSGIGAMGVYWWGILGLIGWSYFIASSVYLISDGKLLVLWIVLVFLLFFSAAQSLGWLAPLQGLREYIWIVGDGALPALTVAGIITSVLYRRLGPSVKQFWLLIATIAVVLILVGFISRPLWGISKIRATFSWATICAGISVIGFLGIVFLTELKRYTRWYSVIRPGGTSTLTCYLIPYLYYAVFGLLELQQLPLALRTGTVGIVKCLLFALLIVFITGLLEKRNIRLKI